MSLPGVIARFATGTYALTRAAAVAGSYDADGIWVPGAATSAQVVASIQPVSGRDLQALPEAQLMIETRLVLATGELKVTDQLTIDGEQWEVIKAEKWIAFGEVHYRCFISRVPTP